jgi:CBS domain-containing protein
MLAKELISDDISPLMTSDTGMMALSMMEEYKVRHLPIVNSESLLGLISEDDILEMPDPEAAIGSFKLSVNTPYVFDYQFVYDVFREMSTQRITLMPVVDSSKRYIGSINMLDLVESISVFTAVSQPGGIIVLNVNQYDYSLSQIAQIVESNDAKILSVYVVNNNSDLEVTIKVNRMDISAIIQTFERYDYDIKNLIFENEQDEMNDRFDSFMKYLNI